MGKIHKLRTSKKQAEEAVRTLLSWAGDDPDRQGLKDTPGRVARAYREWFKGYGEDPEELLRRTSVTRLIEFQEKLRTFQSER